MSAGAFNARIDELEAERRKNLRQAKRATARRRKALRQRRWKDARTALKTARKNRAAARQNLRDIRRIRATRRRANRLARLVRHRRSAGKAADGGQLYWYDGKPVRAEVYPHLVWARNVGHNGRKWKGYVTSAYRTPTYSRSLCRAICGRDSCSGTCAGTASNHVRIALDVTDYTTFGELMKHCPHQPRIFNALPRDRVHFSPSGR